MRYSRLLDLLRLQPRIHPRAPDSSIDIYRCAGIATAAHRLKHLSKIMRIDVLVYENNKARVVSARTAQRAERGTHRMPGKRLLN